MCALGLPWWRCFRDVSGYRLCADTVRGPPEDAFAAVAVDGRRASYDRSSPPHGHPYADRAKISPADMVARTSRSKMPPALMASALGLKLCTGAFKTLPKPDRADKLRENAAGRPKWGKQLDFSTAELKRRSTRV